MQNTPSQIDLATPVAIWLKDHGKPQWRVLASWLDQLAASMEDRHRSGQLLGSILLNDLVIESKSNEFVVRVATARDSIEISAARQFAEFESLQCEAISKTASEAAVFLQEHGCNSDPERLDLLLLGCLSAELASGESVEAFLCRPSATAHLPDSLRRLIDNTIGVTSKHRVQTLAEFRSELAKIRDASVDRNTPALSVARSSADTSKIKGREASPSRSASKAPFDHLGPYQILDRIGGGGMGDVYRGYDPALDRKVAIKVLPAEFARHDEFVSRFRAEASAAAKVEHPNIVPIYSIGCDDGRHYFAMQLIDGETLGELLRREPQLSVERVLEIMEQVLAGLGEAHRHGLVHRDIKPSNILIANKGRRVLIADFGLVKSIAEGSRATATGVVMGTVDYLSPEQGRGLNVDARSDLYSIGVLLFQLLSGRLPFVADTPTALIFQHAYETPATLESVAPGTPRSLCRMVAKLLAKVPADRYQSCDDLLRDIRAIHDRQNPISAIANRNAGAGGTSVIRAPEFRDALSDRLELAAAPKTTWWENLQDRFWAWLGRRSPQLAANLQNTQQQFDYAVKDYEARCAKLELLVLDAEQVRDLLQSQSVAIEKEADQLRAKAIGPTSDEVELRLVELSAESIDIKSQIETQEEQLEEMRLSFAKAKAKSLELTGQRDALFARMRIAEAQLLTDRGPSRSSSSSRWIVGGAIAVATTMFIAAIFFFEPWRNRSAAVQSPANAGFYLGKRSGAPGAPIEIAMRVSTDGSLAELPFEPTCLRVIEGIDGINCLLGSREGDITSLKVAGNKFQNGQITMYETTGKPSSIIDWHGGTKRIAFDMPGGVVAIWNHVDRNAYRELQIGGDIQIIKFSPSGEEILIGSTNLVPGASPEVRIFSVSSGIETKRVSLLTPAATASWLPDESGIVVNAFLNNGLSYHVFGFHREDPISLQESQTGNVGPANRRVEIAFAEGSSRILGVVKGEVLMWNRADGLVQARFGRDIIAANFSQRGALALTLDKQGILSLWDIAQKQMIQIVGTSVDTNAALIALGPNGNFALVVQAGQVKSYPLPKETIAGLQEELRFGGRAEGIALSNRSSIAVVVGNDSVAEWNHSQPSPHLIPHQSSAPSRFVTYSSDGSRFLIGRPEAASGKRAALFLREIGRGSTRAFREYAGHEGGTTGAVFLAQDAQLASGGVDGRLRVWETSSETELWDVDVGSPIRMLAISSDRERVALGTDSPDLLIWNTATHQKAGVLTGHSLAPSSIAGAAEVPRIATGSYDKSVRVWDTVTLESVAQFDHQSPVQTVAITRDGSRVVSGGADGLVKVWHVAHKQLEQTFSGHSGPVTAVSIAADGKTILSAGADQKLYRWSLNPKF